MLICVHLCSLLLFGIAHAADVTVSAHAEPKAVTIGTPFRYVVEIDAPKDVELVIPLLGERFGDFSVTDFGDEPPVEKDGRVRVKRWFQLVAYDVGDRTLPAYPLKYRRKGEEPQDAQGDEVTVIVQSLLAKEPTPLDIRDIAEPEALPIDWRPILIGAGLVALLIAGVGAIYWLATRPRAATLAASPKPHEVALAALGRLRARHLLEAGQFGEYYVDLSSIVRTYVEGRFGLHAPEMTTEEFLGVMQRDHKLKAEHRALLGEFLVESDLVKFARHTPSVEDGERGYSAARRFVEESAEQPDPARGVPAPPRSPSAQDGGPGTARPTPARPTSEGTDAPA